MVDDHRSQNARVTTANNEYKLCMTFMIENNRDKFRASQYAFQ